MIIELTGGASPRIQDYAGSAKTLLLRPIWINDDIDFPALELDTLRKILLSAIAVFGSHVCKTFLTKQIIDELTKVKRDRSRVIVGQRVSL